MDSPDNWMNVDIGKVVLCCRSRVDRLCRITKLVEKEPNQERAELIWNTLAEKEISLCHNIGVAVKARAKEVAEYCKNNLQLMGVTEESIRENPWLICSAAGVQWDRICMFMDAKDAAEGKESE